MLEVSVVISVYKNIARLYHTVQSVLEQKTSFEFNIIIVSDGNSHEEFLKIQELEGAKVVVLENKNNLGLTASLIKGIQNTNAPFIARIDVGDFMITPNRLQIQYDTLMSNPKCVIVGHRYYLYSVILKTLFVSRIKPRIIESVKPGETLFGHVTVMFVKAAYSACGGYNPNMRTGQDSELWPRMLELGHAIFDDRAMTLATMSEDSISVRSNTKQYYNKLLRSLKSANFKLSLITILKMAIPRALRLRLMYTISYAKSESNATVNNYLKLIER